MIRYAILCLSLAIVNVYGNTTQAFPPTSVIVKEKFTKNIPPIALSSTTFMEFVLNSNLFVDKSHLIEQILLDTHRIIVISRPRFWGKTINLNMLKTFLELSVDRNGNAKTCRRALPNYLLFMKGEIKNKNGDKVKLGSPFLISAKKRIVDKHLCKHPVIHVDFKDIDQTTHQDTLNEIKNRIRSTFRKHEYMIDVFYKQLANETSRNGSEKQNVQKRLKFFKKFLSTDLPISENELKESLKFLSETLHHHFKTQVFILIDEYDAAVNSIYSNLNFTDYEKEYFFNFHTYFLLETFNDTTFARGILTGRFPLTKNDLDSGFDEFHHEIAEYTVANGHLMEYYGFQIAEIVNISKISDTSLKYIVHQANASFGSIFEYPHRDIYLYNPRKISNLLSKIVSLKNGLDDEQLLNFLSFFASSGVRSFVRYLYAFKLSQCNGYPLELDAMNRTRFTRNELDLLHKAFKCRFDHAEFAEKLYKIDLDHFPDKSMVFLYSVGYLSIYATTDRTINVAYPCKDSDQCQQFIDVIYQGHMVDARKMLFTVI